MPGVSSGPEFFQFRTPPHQNSGEIPDTSPCREAKIPFRLQRFLSASDQKQNPSGFRYLRKNIWMSSNGSESDAGNLPPLPESGGAGIKKTYLVNATVFEPERYLRERNRKKRLLLREARPLEYENGREIDADEHSDFLSGLMFREEFAREMESLEPQERELVEALIDAEGNLSRAARSIHLEESRARRLRKRLREEKFTF